MDDTFLKNVLQDQSNKGITYGSGTGAAVIGGGLGSAWMQPGVKNDADKIRMELIDPIAMEGLAAVLTFGAKKYAAHNWRGGLAYSRLIGSLLRHTSAILRGEYLDLNKEGKADAEHSGLPHADHIQCCAMFLSNQMKTRPDMDDLWKAPKSDAIAQERRS